MKQETYYSWWQRPDLCYQQQELFFAGQQVRKLVARFDTPSFVYSAQRVIENIQRLHKALADAGLQRKVSLLYAMKANRFAPLLTILKQSGLCGIDACSPAEVELAVSCGFHPEEISFTASSLSIRDLGVLSRYDGLSMDCDSLHAIRAWGSLKPGSKIGLRVNPAMGISRADNDKLQYAGTKTTKFGIYGEQFPKALQLAREYGLRVSKIHFHTGCGYLTPQLPQLEGVITRCLEFVEQVEAVERVNIGGGLGVPHTAEDKPLDLQQWAAVLARQFGGRSLQVEVEPGDYLVKDAGILLLGKTFMEQKQDTWFIGVDAGFNIAPEPAYYNLPFQPVPLHYDKRASSRQVQVVGNINEALDVWFDQAWFPDMQDESSLVLLNAGAYGAAMASNHCLRGEFKEFILL